MDLWHTGKMKIRNYVYTDADRRGMTVSSVFQSPGAALIIIVGLAVLFTVFFSRQIEGEEKPSYAVRTQNMEP